MSSAFFFFTLTVIFKIKDWSFTLKWIKWPVVFKKNKIDHGVFLATRESFYWMVLQLLHIICKQLYLIDWFECWTVDISLSIAIFSRRSIQKINRSMSNYYRKMREGVFSLFHRLFFIFFVWITIFSGWAFGRWSFYISNIVEPIFIILLVKLFDWYLWSFFLGGGGLSFNTDRCIL